MVTISCWYNINTSMSDNLNYWINNLRIAWLTLLYHILYKKWAWFSFYNEYSFKEMHTHFGEQRSPMQNQQYTMYVTFIYKWVFLFIQFL